MILLAIALYITVAVAVTMLHDYYLRNEDEPRPIASAVIGLIWPLFVAIMALAVIVGLAIDLFRRGAP